MLKSHLSRALVVLSLLAGVAGVAQAREFHEGELWSYKTRPGDAKSRLLITKVEANPANPLMDQIYHISVLNVRMKGKNGDGADKRPTTSKADKRAKGRKAKPDTAGETDLPHFPVSKETLEQSCVKIVGKRPSGPKARESYKLWRTAYEKGNAGVFNIPVADIVGLVEGAKDEARSDKTDKADKADKIETVEKKD